jgi:peptidoglycan/LPS O-acetylase OafA/YrhL
MVNRLIRIVPYFWAASLVFLGLTTATGRTYHPAALFNNLTIFPLYNPMTFDPPALLVGWSLAFELAFYTVVSFSIWIAPMPSARLRIVAQIAALLAVTGFILQPNMDLLAIWANSIWLEFLLGIAVYQLWKLPSMFVPSTACWLLIAAGTVGLSQSILFGFPFQTPHWGILNENAGLLRSIWWATPYAMLLLGLLWLSEISRSLSKSGLWDFLRRVGDASYSLYLVHLMVIFAWEDLAPTNTINPDLVILVLLAVNVLLALLCYRWFEAPMLRTLRQKLLGTPTRLGVQVPA